MIAAIVAVGVGFRLRRIAFQPAAHIVVIGLLAPQQAGKRLPLDTPRVFAQVRVNPFFVELVALFFTLLKIASNAGPKNSLAGL